MTEMGIQMELTQRRSGVMRRAITRRPRVDSNSKPKRFSLRSSDGSYNEESADDEDGEYEKAVNIDFSISFEDAKFHQPEHHDRKKKRSQRRLSSHTNQASKRPRSKKVRNSEQLPIAEKVVDDPADSQHVDSSLSEKKIMPTRPTGSRNKTKTFSRARAMSLGNVIPAADANFAQPLVLKPAGLTSPEREMTGSDYDAGSQILESYSEGLQYSMGSPKFSRKKQVKTFFRRLAGSLESLLGIKRRQESHDSNQSTTNVQKNPAYNNPALANQSPFESTEERFSTEIVASIETTISHEGTARNTNDIDSNKREIKTTAREANEVAFHRGKRVYTPSLRRSEKSQNLLITPVPPRKPGGRRRRAIGKARTHRSHLGTRKPEYTGASYDWETRSDTDDSEGFAFQSNKLATLGGAFQSDDEEQSTSIDRKSLEKLEDTPDSQIASGSTEAVPQRNIPVKISDFRPPGNLSRQLSNHRHSRTPSGSKGPMKALRSSDISDPIARSESTGRFDGSKRFVKRKIRRRNSSFVPGKEGATPAVLTETALKEAISFEQIMSSINDLANTLEDKVSMSSTSQLSKEDKMRKQMTSTTEDRVSEPPTDESVQLSRNQSWVGKVSHRLDDLLDSVDSGGSGCNSSREKLPRKISKQGTPTSSKVNLPRKQVKKKKSNIVRKEKVSFDELESDFKNFAKQVREKRQSNERVNAIGQ